MKALGALYRSYLVDDTSLLPDRFFPNRVFIGTSWVRRTQESALAFFEGLYPPLFPGETLDIDAGDQADPMLPVFGPSTDAFAGGVDHFVN
jgi:hypothetical protein